MKTKIIMMILIISSLCIACSPTKEEKIYVCTTPTDKESFKLTITVEDDIVLFTKQVTYIDLSSFSEDEIKGLEATIKSGEFQKDLKKVDGVNVTTKTKKNKIEVQITIDFQKVELSELYDLQLINIYNKEDNEQNIKDYLEYQEDYYKLDCKENK